MYGLFVFPATTGDDLAAQFTSVFFSATLQARPIHVMRMPFFAVIVTNW